MRLLRQKSNGDLEMTWDLREETPYAILSHTWLEDDQEEISFEDFDHSLLRSSFKQIKPAGMAKVQFLANQAAKDGLQYFWIDTCCVDKGSSAEVQDAIYSLYRWFRNAVTCYVFLADLSTDPSSHVTTHIPTGIKPLEAALHQCRWFTRGWTLQELLAPATVEFFSREGTKLGDKWSLERCVHEITGIPRQALRDNSLTGFSSADKLAWSKHRISTRREDRAYCLLGILNVFMPMIYGEGDHALTRLGIELGIKKDDLDRILSTQDETSLGNDDALMDVHVASDVVSVLSIDATPSLTSASTLSDGSSIKKSAAEEFVDLLLDDDAMQTLFSVAIERSGPDKFKQNFLRLLMRLAVELRAEASCQVHFDAAQLIKSRANFIASRITETIELGEVQSRPRARIADRGRFVLDRFLQQQQQAEETHKSFIPEINSGPGIYKDEYIEPVYFDEPVNPALKSLNEVKRFVVESRAYEHFLQGFSHFASPQGEIIDAATKQLDVEKGTVGTLYRLHWTCPCGHKEYDDFIGASRGSIANLADRLQADGVRCRIEEDPFDSEYHHLYRLFLLLRNPAVGLINLSARVSSHLSPQTNSHTLPPESSRLPDVAEPSGVTQPDQHGAVSGVGQQNSNASGSARTADILDKEEAESSKFMLLCSDDRRWLTTWKGLEVSPIKSDKELFKKIHDKLNETRHWTHRFFSLKSVQRISFVKFALHTRQEVDHLQHDQIPPPEKTHYDFHERNPTHVPPFLNNYLMHRFSNNENCHDGEICLHQFPKRVGGQPKRGCAPDHDTAWGLYFQKGWDLQKLWACGVMAMLSSVLFGVLWAICRRSVQDGFSVASYVVTAEMVLVGTVQVAIGVNLT